MKKSPAISFNAAFLLIVFSLNTLIGLACSLGLDMGFNHHHHPGREMAHHHGKDKAHSHAAHSDKGNCCQDEARKFASADKSVPQLPDFNQAPFLYYSLLPVYYQLLILPPDGIAPSDKYLVQHHHPPIPDIRLAVQSFQI
jgi:hypothetical protein